ncbi:hypothetical protein [Owenweeksia hongkongensis]|uniref:hypothetical protein n=1 Tax=Owenweeksia hongkongensis TaxID=253245 RepID=UPI003A923DF9
MKTNMLIFSQKLFHVVSIILLFSLTSLAQEVPFRSLGVGMGTGVTSTGMDEGPNFTLGLDINHQRNFSDFFSLRIGLGLNYFLPTHLEYYNENGTNWSSTEYNQVHMNATFSAMPVFYIRAEAVSVYFGVASGVGGHITSTEVVDEADIGVGEIISDESRTVRNYLMVNLRPVIGVSFNVFESDELQLEVSQNFWKEAQDLADDDFWEPDVSLFSVTLSYRFGFSK